MNAVIGFIDLSYV